MSTSKPRNTIQENYWLATKQDGWNLAGVSLAATSRTRNAGSGRLNLVKRVYNECSSTTDSDYEAAESSSKEEVEFNEESSDGEEEEVDEDDEQKKPQPTRLFLEYESLKKCMEKNCRCPKCDGPVRMKVKTLCLASHVMLCCVDTDCGYVDVSEQPATAEVGARLMIVKEVQTLRSMYSMFSDSFHVVMGAQRLHGCLDYWVFLMIPQCNQGPLVLLKRGSVLSSSRQQSKSF
jgi:hypothetical protein